MNGWRERLFGTGRRASPDDLSSDPRWRRLHDRNWACPCCGRTFGEPPDIGDDHPDQWPHGNRQHAGVSMLEVGHDKLTPDLCTIGEERFIRCVLPIPIIGTGDTFHLGPWASLKPENFDLYVKAWANNDYSEIDGFFGWLCNVLPGLGMSDDDEVPCSVINLGGPDRPELRVHEGSHPLADIQRKGISFDQLLDIYALCGDDIRPHLTDA